MDKVRALLEDGKHNVNCIDDKGRTSLHCACEEGYIDMVRVLISDFNADKSKEDYRRTIPLQVAAEKGNMDLVLILINEFGCNPDNREYKKTVLHSACEGGNVSLVRTLIDKYGTRTDVKGRIGSSHWNESTPLQAAVFSGKREIVALLVNEYGCDPHDVDNKRNSLLHYASEGGHADLVQTLIQDYNVCVNSRNWFGDVPLQVAASHGRTAVVESLIKHFGCDSGVRNISDQTLLHLACKSGNVDLVRTLLREHGADMNATDSRHDTPLHVAAWKGREEVVLTLIEEFACDPDVKGYAGGSLLHSACWGGSVEVFQSVQRMCNFSIDARDDRGNTPLHVATLCGHIDMVVALITEFGCCPSITGYLGQSLLHAACASRSGEVVSTVGKYVSPLVSDDNGDTPLHIACSVGSARSVKAMLKLNPPILVRNDRGKTPRDMAPTSPKSPYFNDEKFDAIDEYMVKNRSRIYDYYNNVQKRAKRKYSGAKCITRIFFIGDRGAGKSTLVETLKREGFFSSLWRVSEFTIPPHTAGIVPSIHTSKYYGRVVFYDFAGDPEYYSSHAAILENLVSSTKGENLFILVVDLREDSVKIRKILHYWLSFIQHQKFNAIEPSLLVVGSHSDEISIEEAGERIHELQLFCDSIEPGCGLTNEVVHFVLDCRDPKATPIASIQGQIVRLTKDSPRHKLSLQASMLLGLLEKDFRSEPVFPVTELLSHIEATGIQLPTEVEPLYSTLQELHDVGLLFIVHAGTNDDSHVVIFNVSKLTNEAHRRLFSSEAKLRLKKRCLDREGSTSSFNIGIISQTILENTLPKNITKECLVHLQYCQHISHTDVGAFPSLANSANQSFLFFPALCSADKGDVSWVIPRNLSYSIGWLARCTEPRDYTIPHASFMSFSLD